MGYDDQSPVVVNIGILKDEFDAEVAARLSDKADNALQSGSVKGTIQSITFDVDGTVQKVQHKDGINLIREDVFTYAPNLITEVRTLTSGGSITFINHLDTLETEVI